MGSLSRNVLPRVLKELQQAMPPEMADESVAEFLVSINLESQNLQDFKQKLKDNEAPFEDSFVEKIYEVVRRGDGTREKETNYFKTKVSIEPKQEVDDVNVNVKQELCDVKNEATVKVKSEPNDKVKIESNDDDQGLNLKAKLEDGLSHRDILRPRNDSEYYYDNESDITDRRQHYNNKNKNKNSSDSQYYSGNYNSKVLSPSKNVKKERPNDFKNEQVDEFGRAINRKYARDEDGFLPNLANHHRSFNTNANDNYINDRHNDYQNSVSLDPEPIVGKVYQGKVMNITNFGAFVRLYGIECSSGYRKRFVEGLCHISQFSNVRISHPSDIVSKDEMVFMKVKEVNGNRVSLTMKNIDQTTGIEDKMSNANNSLGDFEVRGRHMETQQQQRQRPKKKLTSPERWELRQLISSGAISIKDHPELEEDLNDYTTDMTVEPAEEDVDIEIKQDDPPFLQDQKEQLGNSGIDDAEELSKLKIVQKPDGSLNRAAMKGSQLAKDMKEKKLKELREKRLQAIKDRKKKNSHKDDPLQQQQNNGTNNGDQGEEMSTLSEWQKANMKQKITYGKRTSLPMKQQRESLPVFKSRSKLLELVRNNQFVVIVGETGSGKTTQITQYLAEENLSQHGIIGCTQPRRVAAISVAKRVSEEVGCRLGNEVGYTVRFDDKSGPDTKIKYMTDGMLQREALLDPNMTKYSVIMLDEAHERTIATDVLFALLKKAAKNRPDLKLIVTSATLDAEKFSNYFNGCPILKIPGRTFPVEVLYTKEPEFDYLAACLDTVLQIHISEPAGDILVFLTGQEEIDTACEALFDRVKALGKSIPELIILPVYSSLPSEVQSRIFEPTPEGSRKCVIATNIAETSITIDGIYYVIDPGFVKVNAYDSKLGMDSLIVSPISQAQANQRAGRAGRTGPGKCFRLYTENAYNNEMLPNTVPEIQRQNLSNTILMLKAMGIDDLIKFEFMDPPPTKTMMLALEELYNLSALDEEGHLTRLGREMAEFPMDPSLAKALLMSVDLHCADELTTIVAMLSVQTIFYRPKNKQQQADLKKSKFNSTLGDHLTLLNVYNSWVQNDYSKKWCEENYIQERSLKRAKDVRNQLIKIMIKYRLSIDSCGRDFDRVRKALCSGFFKNSAKRDAEESGAFKTLIEETPVFMHPSSALFGKRAEYVIYHTLLLTTKEYMHCVTLIEPKWLVDVAPTFFKIGDPNNRRKKGGKLVSLHKRRKM